MEIDTIDRTGIHVTGTILLTALRDALTDEQRLEMVRNFICDSIAPDFIVKLMQLVNEERWNP